MASLDDLAPLDLTVDGADEADRNLDLIKGGGGMLLREKIVAASSKKMIVIADETKMVPRLGKFPLPVEVVEFGHKATAERLVKALEALGYDQPLLRLREAEAEAFRTDCGNVIYDCHLGAIQNAAKLGSAIHAVPGVVEHGLFIGMATTLLVATPGEVEVISR
jgi:ribose 5-phosphate isomerase A